MVSIIIKPLPDELRMAESNPPDMERRALASEVNVVAKRVGKNCEELGAGV